MTTSDNKVSKRALTEEIFNQRRELVAEIVRLKNKAGELQMYRTMHALDRASQDVGWELMETMEKKP